MKFTNQKDFFDAVFVLQQKQPWSLIALRNQLSMRFENLIPPKSKRITLWKSLIAPAITLVGMFIFAFLWGNKSISGFMELVSVLLLVIVVTWIYIVFEIGGNSREEAYLHRKYIADMMLKDLDFEITRTEKNLASQQKTREETVSGDPEVMLKNSDVFGYMTTEQLAKYWHEYKLPQRLKEIDGQIENTTSHLAYIKEEKRFLTEIE